MHKIERKTVPSLNFLNLKSVNTGLLYEGHISGTTS